MKKIIFFFIILIFSNNCSFDNKTGIWKEEDNIIKKVKKNNSNFKTVFTKNKAIQKEILNNGNIEVKVLKPLRNKNWLQQDLINNNNVPNLFYIDKKILISKSSKLSKFLDESPVYKILNNNILIKDNNVVFYDHKGSIFLYSLETKKKILNYNFYKKEYKKYNKEISLVIDNEIIYVADNIGYMYAIDVKKKQIVWAKNYGVPFRSNMKVIENQIVLANQDNIIYSINKFDGVINWQFATSPQFLKSNFISSIISDYSNNVILFLNTNGELYSFDYVKKNISWVLNFKSSLLTLETQLFSGVPLVSKDNNIITSDGTNLMNIEITSGGKIWDKPIAPKLMPIINNDNIFLVTKNDYLMCLKLSDGTIKWSRNIVNQLTNTGIKKINSKSGPIKSSMLANNKILLFSDSGYLLGFDYKNGDLLEVSKILKKGLGSAPVFSDGKMYIFDKKYKLHSIE